MKKIKNILNQHKEIVSYVLFGAATTLVNWVTYSALVEVLGTGMYVANVAAWVVAVIFAYITNKIWVFESKCYKFANIIREFGLFLGARILSGVFEMVMFPIFMYCGVTQKIFGIKGMWAKIIISVGVIILNYIFSKVLVFRKQEESGNEKTAD